MLKEKNVRSKDVACVFLAKKINRIVLASAVLAFVLSCSSSLFAQQNFRDVIYLKNGSIIRGIITEQVPNVSYKIETADGSVFVYSADEVDKIAKERFQNVSNLKEKDPVLSCIASLFITGLGQVVNDQPLLGVCLFLGNVTGMVITISADEEEIALAGLLLSIACHLTGIIQAPIYASSYNDKLRRGLIVSEGVYLKIEPDLSIKTFGTDKAMMNYGVSFKLNF